MIRSTIPLYIRVKESISDTADNVLIIQGLPYRKVFAIDILTPFRISEYSVEYVISENREILIVHNEVPIRIRRGVLYARL